MTHMMEESRLLKLRAQISGSPNVPNNNWPKEKKSHCTCLQGEWRLVFTEGKKGFIGDCGSRATAAQQQINCLAIRQLWVWFLPFVNVPLSKTHTPKLPTNLSCTNASMIGWIWLWCKVLWTVSVTGNRLSPLKTEMNTLFTDTITWIFSLVKGAILSVL